MSSALDGIRVIDLTRGVGGPYAGRLLAEFGADVIKVEPPGGDQTRRFGPFPNDVPHPERSGLFLHLNRNKRSVVLDPVTDGESIRALVADAHIVLEDYAPGVAADAGWGYEVLAAMNPALVLTSITAFGQTGPYRDYKGSEITLQAIGGPLITNGHADREPLKLGGHYAEYHGGLAAALASLMALRRAETTGVGDWIDISLFECQAGCRDRRVIQLTIAAYTGRAGGRLASTKRNFASGVRECMDGYVNILGLGARMPRFLTMIGLTEEAKTVDPFALSPEQKESFEATYREWLAVTPKQKAVEIAQDHALLAGAFNTVADVASDPHYASRGVWDVLDHPEAGTLRYPGRPFVMSGAQRVAPAAAPLLDQHGAEIRAGLGAAARPSQERSLPATLELPLAGVRVAEITVVWAGPHVTQLLGEWGADIVRVEPCNKVQPVTRGMEQVPNAERVRQLAASGAPVGFPDNEVGEDPWNRNASFNSHARNKRSMACDIMTDEGREAVLRLVKECDVLVENNVPETIDKAGLDFEILSAINPRLIMLRMPAFALEGKYRNFRAFGLHVEAMIGHTLLRGYQGEGPELLSESLASDGISGVQGALAIMMALRHRESTGKGQLIELPLTEGFLPVLGEYIMDYTMNGRDTPAQGNSHRTHAPHNLYPCAGEEQWIAIDVEGDDDFVSLSDVLGLSRDERFATNAARLANVAALDEAIGAATGGRGRDELLHALQGVGVCAAPALNAVDALDDAHLGERGFFEALPTGVEGVVKRYPGIMFRMQRTPNRLRSGPVLLGDHNHEIYCDLLGYSEQELAALEAKGIVGTTFPTSMWTPS